MPAGANAPTVHPGLQVRSDPGPEQVSACQHPEQFVPMTLPSFLCIGATKAGTTWLHDQLDQHPGVCMPLVKELHYFSARHSPGHRQWAEQTVDKAFRRELRHARRRADTGETDREDARHLRRIRSHEIFSDDWYRACFDRPGHGGRVVGEITPAYAELPVEGIAEMQRMLPGVRIIHILRHPYDRALSHLRMSLHRRGMPVDEEGMLKMLDRQPQIFSRGAYEQQVPRWREAIPADRYLILPFGTIRERPLEILRQVEAFIGVAPFEGYRSEKAVNKTRQVEIPEAVLTAIQQRVRPTVDYLTTEFGTDFLNATR